MGAMIELSEIARNPAVAAFLARGERGAGATFAVPTTPKPVLTGGEAVPA
ncbi:hypothetical protein GOA99_19880 [Sinorhizobium meliloti]|nr:hypothetical protein [Sinorhizobium meliloti]MDW9363593.1 hypothetical protein [Sinorhizobium meliloti]MDW9386894.1 hypothetical protein [Sinorhizobium meliloti]MDW9408137.1 hypothetical protein [Sinorhizobium meliloti]MDW9453500.1 hypothetical protein [Sinorhizobium meliloti]MDW9466139.1 hypothetical protein [Sinorhizobium meliloti]